MIQQVQEQDQVSAEEIHNKRHGELQPGIFLSFRQQTQWRTGIVLLNFFALNSVSRMRLGARQNRRLCFLDMGLGHKFSIIIASDAYTNKSLYTTASIFGFNDFIRNILIIHLLNDIDMKLDMCQCRFINIRSV